MSFVFKPSVQCRLLALSAAPTVCLRVRYQGSSCRSAMFKPRQFMTHRDISAGSFAVVHIVFAPISHRAGSIPQLARLAARRSGIFVRVGAWDIRGAVDYVDYVTEPSRLRRIIFCRDCNLTGP
jgi:hypothetical protein